MKMAPQQVTQVLLKCYVKDRPVTPDDFEVATSTIDPDSLREGEVMVELL